MWRVLAPFRLSLSGVTLLTLTGVTQLTPAAAEGFRLPSGTFVVLPVPWELSLGEAPQDELLSQSTTTNDCECLAQCFMTNNCLSLGYDAANRSCVLYNIRGNVNSPRPHAVRYRVGMAYLGDWCSSEEECKLLTSGVATCQQNTCICPEGQYPQNRSSCGDDPLTWSGDDFTNVTESSTNQQAATTETSTTVETTTSGISTIAQQTSTPSAISGDSTITSTDTTSSPTDDSTSTASPSTTTMTPTTTAASTTPAAPTTSTSPTTSTTPTASTTTTASATPTTTTSPTTPTPTTSAAPSTDLDVVYVHKLPIFRIGDNHMDCTEDDSQPMVMVGLKDAPDLIGRWKDLDQVRCARYNTYPDLSLGPKEKITKFDMYTTEYKCDSDSVLVSVVSHLAFFVEPKGIMCADLEGPYKVDTKDCQTVTITDPAAFQTPIGADWPFQCPQLPEPVGITSVTYDIDGQEQHWKAITCCRIIHNM